MSCGLCSKYQEKGMVAYYRYGTANVGLIGCPKHIKLVINDLNECYKRKNKKC